MRLFVKVYVIKNGDFPSVHLFLRRVLQDHDAKMLLVEFIHYFKKKNKKNGSLLITNFKAHEIFSHHNSSEPPVLPSIFNSSTSNNKVAPPGIFPDPELP